MTKLEDMREEINKRTDVIKISDQLFIKVDSIGTISLHGESACDSTENVIEDQEIKPLIKALQDLVK